MSQAKTYLEDTPKLNLASSTRIFQADNGIDSGTFVLFQRPSVVTAPKSWKTRLWRILSQVGVQTLPH